MDNKLIVQGFFWQLFYVLEVLFAVSLEQGLFWNFDGIMKVSRLKVDCYLWGWLFVCWFGDLLNWKRRNWKFKRKGYNWKVGNLGILGMKRRVRKLERVWKFEANDLVHYSQKIFFELDPLIEVKVPANFLVCSLCRYPLFSFFLCYLMVDFGFLRSVKYAAEFFSLEVFIEFYLEAVLVNKHKYIAVFDMLLMLVFDCYVAAWIEFFAVVFDVVIEKMIMLGSVSSFAAVRLTVSAGDWRFWISSKMKHKYVANFENLRLAKFGFKWDKKTAAGFIFLGAIYASFWRIMVADLKVLHDSAAVRFAFMMAEVFLKFDAIYGRFKKTGSDLQKYDANFVNFLKSKIQMYSLQLRLCHLPEI